MRLLKWSALIVGAICVYLVVDVVTYCLVEGEVVDTPSGPRAVETLEVGDAVWSQGQHGELARGTVAVVRSGYSLRQLRIVLADARTLELTASHPVATPSGWLRAGDLPGQTTVLTRDGPQPIDIETVFAFRTVYDLTIEPHANFYANGVLVHNKTYVSPEAIVISDTRRIRNAMSTYSELNCGFYPRSLTDATRVDGTPIAIPGYPDHDPDPLLGDLALASPYERRMYRRRYQAFGQPQSVPPSCGADSALSYCYSSQPTREYDGIGDLLPGWLARHLPLGRYRSFLVTSDGAILFDRRGRDLSCDDEGRPPPFAEYLD